MPLWRLPLRGRTRPAYTSVVFVFVISNGRSGSTLVHELLARHPEVGFVSNLEDRIPGLPAAAGRLNNTLYRRVPTALTRKGRLRFAPSEAWRALGREVSPMLVRSSRDLVAADAMPWVADRFRRFFDRHRAGGPLGAGRRLRRRRPVPGLGPGQVARRQVVRRRLPHPPPRHPGPAAHRPSRPGTWGGVPSAAPDGLAVAVDLLAYPNGTPAEYDHATVATAARVS